MKKYSLVVEDRTEVGKKVKHLRSAGKIPATVYGKGVKSASITLSTDAFKKVYSEAGATGLIELQLGSQMRPVLVHHVQADPVNDALLHIEFHQVDLKEKVHANIPLEILGEAPAVTQKLGVLLRVLDEIEVEALPTELPEKVLVDVTGLENVDMEVKVANLKVPNGVSVLTSGELTVVKVGPLVTKEAEAQAAAEEQAAAEAQATSEGAAPESQQAEGAQEEPKSASEAKSGEDKKAE